MLALYAPSEEGESVGGGEARCAVRVTDTGQNGFMASEGSST